MDTFNLKSTILGVLKPSEIVDQSSPEYKLESQTWQAHRNLHPRIMARPNSVDSLARLVRLLIDSDLDFAVRCQGVGDASARDVLISLANFKELIFDKDNETIIVGAGCSWAEVETNMAAQAPGYQGQYTRCRHDET